MILDEDESLYERIRELREESLRTRILSLALCDQSRALLERVSADLKPIGSAQKKIPLG